MTDTLAPAPAAVEADAPVAPAAAPVAAAPAPAASPVPAPPAAPTFSADDVRAIVAQALAEQAAASAAASAPAAPRKAPIAETNLFAKGHLVKHTYVDPYDGREHTRMGIVVDTLPNQNPEVGARSCVAWLGGVSGPIGDGELAPA